MGQYALTIVIAVLLLGFVIYQQMRTRSLNPRQLILPPALLAVLGIANLQNHPPASDAAGIALAVSIATALVFGVARGVSTEIWWSDVGPLRKGTAITLALWIVGIGLRLVIGVVAHREGVTDSVTAGEIPLFLGVTLAAQNAVIWVRSQNVLIPGSRPTN